MSPTETPPPMSEPVAEAVAESRPWETLATLIGQGVRRPVREFLESLSGTDTVLAISRLDDDLQTRLLTLLRPEQAAGLVDQLSDAHAAELVERLEPDAAARILDEMPSAEQADLLGELDAADAEAILAALPTAKAEEIRALAGYDGDVAGGIMGTEYLAYPETATVGQVSRDLRVHGEEYSDYEIQYAYVVDQERRLVGVLRMRDLLLAPAYKPLTELMIPAPMRVRDRATLDELQEFFEQHAILGVPVVDDRDVLVGLVHRSAVDAALAERAEGSFLKSRGIVAGEELRTMPLWTRSSRRLSWLSVNILLNVVAASVIAFFEDTLKAVIALAVFLPIISDMSGCSGNQAVAVSMRELTLGYVRPSELVRVWLKEISVGVVNGIALGLLIAGVAWMWKGNPWLGVVVGLAMALNTMVAVSVGGLIPLVLKRLGRDPALASSPILTTVTDMCGFFFVLGLATLAMPYLQ